jgi:hypothetical protein
VLFNFANGNTYRDGMFVIGNNTAVKNINQVNLQLKITNTELLLMTAKQVLLRTSKTHLTGPLYMLMEARVEGDSFEVYCDTDVCYTDEEVLPMGESVEQEQNEIIENREEEKTLPNIC